MREMNHFRGRIADEEVERRVIAWADITLLALELKRAVLRQKHPECSEDEILIILKLLSNREQDGLDARKILEIQKENLDMEYLRTRSEKLGIKIESFIK